MFAEPFEDVPIRDRPDRTVRSCPGDTVDSQCRLAPGASIAQSLKIGVFEEFDRLSSASKKAIMGIAEGGLAGRKLVGVVEREDDGDGLARAGQLRRVSGFHLPEHLLHAAID